MASQMKRPITLAVLAMGGDLSCDAVHCTPLHGASLINNPTGWDSFKHRMRAAVIGFFQRRLDERAAKPVAV